MSIFKIVVSFILTLIIFLGLDGIWLVKVAPRLYKHFIGHLLAAKPNLVAALVFYLLFISGLLIFVIIPALNKHSLGYAALYGALFGFFTYMTFDLTSQAVFKNWPSAISVIDISWGVILSTLVSIFSYSVINNFIK